MRLCYNFQFHLKHIIDKIFQICSHYSYIYKKTYKTINKNLDRQFASIFTFNSIKITK